jgi:23S rRNA pseudouridine1911/1915/1917 synthase
MSGALPIHFIPDFTVLDETEDWIVLDKPAPLQVHPAKPNGASTLLDGVQALLCYEMANGAVLSIINRLDRETSGTVLMAKHARMARIFGKAMMRRQFRKTYWAVCWGWPEADEFTVEAAILRRGEVAETAIYLLQCVHPDGAASRTRFRVLRRFEKSTTAGTRFCLLQAEPETGRMHQIRVHAQHAGFPLIGDKLYGPDSACYLEHIQTGWTRELASRLLLPRHALHSHALAVDLEDGPSLRWLAPLPADLASFLPPENDRPNALPPAGDSGSFAVR